MAAVTWGAFRVGGKVVRRPRIRATNARIWRGGAHSRIRDVFVVGYASKLKHTLVMLNGPTSPCQ
jgi:hypothetical protein